MRRMWAFGGAAVLLASLWLTGPAALGADPPGPDGVRGSIWRGLNGEDPAFYLILHADGTLLGVDPYLGYSVGRWQPNDERTISGVMVAADVDPDRFTNSPGVSTTRWEAAVGDGGETLDGSWTATREPADGTAPSTVDDTFSLTRLHSAPMPPEAIASTPPDPGWQPVLSPVAGGGGRVDFEPYDPPNHNVIHPDGTGFSFNAWVGPAVSLGWPIDEASGIGTSWFTKWDPDDPPLVAEVEDTMDGTGYSVRYWESGNADTGTGTYMTLAAPDGTPLAVPDPALWPGFGSAWIERNGDQAPSLWIVWADGTVLHIDPGLGTGLGLWQPTGEGTAPVAIRYNVAYPRARDNTMRGVADLTGEMTIDEAAATLTTTYAVEITGEPREAVEPSGTMVADRIELEPTTE